MFFKVQDFLFQLLNQHTYTLLHGRRGMKRQIVPHKNDPSGPRLRLRFRRSERHMDRKANTSINFDLILKNDSLPRRRPMRHLEVAEFALISVVSVRRFLFYEKL